MTDTIHLTTDSDLDDVAELLDELGVEYTRHDRFTDRETISVPGYGDIWRDERPGLEAGFVVTAIEHFQKVDYPADAADLERELREVGGMVAQAKAGTVDDDWWRRYVTPEAE